MCHERQRYLLLEANMCHWRRICAMEDECLLEKTTYVVEGECVSYEADVYRSMGYIP